MNRSQIVANEHILSMEPKVLQVLLVLAKNQGQVVGHDAILAEVWPDVVVAPNALQRCIAQLRKAFGDDAKSQKVIATYPKVGYSLLANVDWHRALPESTSQNETLISAQQVARWRRVALSLAFVMVLLVGAIAVLTPEPEPFAVTRLKALTATDDKEFHPAFSPDGRYIAFERFIAMCKSHIWVKDLQQGNEYQLTEQPGVFGQLAWSPDGSTLAFSHIAQCTQERSTMGCSALHRLSFTLAKASPQPTEQMLGCTDEHYGAVNWLDDNRVVYKASKDNLVQVRTLNLKTNQQSILLDGEGFRPFALSYSQHLKQLAVTGLDQEQNPVMMRVMPGSGEKHQIRLQIPKDSQADILWDPTWHPSENYLLVSAGSTLFKIGEDGRFSEFEVPTMEAIYTPIFHPDGKRIAATMGTQDFDIVQVSGIGDKPAPPQVQVIHRSIVEDYQARFRPNSDEMSFVSKRSGHEQLWLDRKGTPVQLTHLQRGERLSSYIWSDDGRFMIAVVNGSLQVLHLDGQMQRIDTSFRVKAVYQHLGGNEVLLATVEHNRSQLMAFNISTGQARLLYDGFTFWAQQDAQGVLYFSDYLRKLQLKRPGKAKEPFMVADELILYSPFIVREQVLHMVGKGGALWQVNLETLAVTPVGITGLNDMFWELSDIAPHEGRMLVSKMHSARKEIVLFE